MSEPTEEDMMNEAQYQEDMRRQEEAEYNRHMQEEQDRQLAEEAERLAEQERGENMRDAYE